MKTWQKVIVLLVLVGLSLLGLRACIAINTDDEKEKAPSSVIGEGGSENVSTTLPPAGSVDCGVVTVFGVQERIVSIRGSVACDEAKQVTAAYDVSINDLPQGWICSTGRVGESADFECTSTATPEKSFVLRSPGAPLNTN